MVMTCTSQTEFKIQYSHKRRDSISGSLHFYISIFGGFIMEMQFKNEIKKLADIVVWADNGIEEMRMDLSSLTEEKFKNLDAVKDLETVKKVVLESMERQTVYSNALNKDIADKAAKIELLEKEI